MRVGGCRVKQRSEEPALTEIVVRRHTNMKGNGYERGSPSEKLMSKGLRFTHISR